MNQVEKSCFVYISICCNSPAVKPACVKVRAVAKKKGKGDREKAPEFSHLGHWSCTQCGKGCKVSRHNRKVEEPQTVTA